MIGMPNCTEGVLVSGGSIANVTGFLAARAELGRGVSYYTDQTHSSLHRGRGGQGRRFTTGHGDRYRRHYQYRGSRSVARDRRPVRA
jgi:hypothetical protein